MFNNRKYLILAIAVLSGIVLSAIYLTATEKASEIESAIGKDSVLDAQVANIRAGEDANDASSARPNSICYMTTVSTKNTVEVDIIANIASEKILGLGFDFIFNSSALEFTKYENGNFFERGGSPIYLSKAVKDNQKSKIITGISLRRSDTLPTGTGTIIKLFFKKKSGKNYNFAFSETKIATLENGARKDLNDIEWCK